MNYTVYGGQLCTPKLSLADAGGLTLSLLLRFSYIAASLTPSVGQFDMAKM